MKEGSRKQIRLLFALGAYQSVLGSFRHRQDWVGIVGWPFHVSAPASLSNIDSQRWVVSSSYLMGRVGCSNLIDQ